MLDSSAKQTALTDSVSMEAECEIWTRGERESNSVRGHSMLVEGGYGMRGAHHRPSAHRCSVIAAPPRCRTPRFSRFPRRRQPPCRPPRNECSRSIQSAPLMPEFFRIRTHGSQLTPKPSYPHPSNPWPLRLWPVKSKQVCSASNSAVCSMCTYGVMLE